MRPKLDRWVVYGNVIVGYIYDDRRIANGTRVTTDAVRFIDPINFQAECLDGKYTLGVPGTVAEHQEPLIGKPKDSFDGEANFTSSIILNPRG